MYKIIGADQKEYGPVSGEQLRQWLAEGRVNAATRIQLEGSGAWKPLSEVPEFASVVPPMPPPPLSLPPTAAPANNKLAVWSLVLGALSMFQCCQIICGPLAIIFGFIALSQIKVTPSQTGSGFAIGGIIMGVIGLLIGVVALLVIMRSPEFLQNIQNSINH